MAAATGLPGRGPDRDKTSRVYGLIRDGQYQSALAALSAEREQSGGSGGPGGGRAALSLMGYCHYHLQQFDEAAVAYEQLVRLCPTVTEYRVHLAQCLHLSGQWAEASKAAKAIEDPQYAARVLHLQAAIKYAEGDTVAARAYVAKCLPEDPETKVALGCVAYKEGDFETASQHFTEAMGQLGYQPDLAYSTAVCAYRTKQYDVALRHVGDIVERGVREHPELGVGLATEGGAVRSVGNSQALKETSLVEAFNLRCAVEFQLGNVAAAREALSDIPPRSEEELDPVTLHNLALAHMDDDPTGGFKKLNFLLQSPPFPPETFANLLLLYIRYQYYDLAADVLADNVHLHDKCLGQELYEYLEATIHTQSAPEEAYRKFDALALRHTENLRRLTKQIQDARLARDNDAIKVALKEFDGALERFMPVLMSQAKIYWDLRKFAAVERVFRQSSEFCSEHETWKLNLAHVFFVQNKFTDANRYYEPIVQRAHRLLDIPAVVLANLCVGYIMNSLNGEAEELMKQIEQEEEEAERAGARPSYTLTVINAALGVLYASKGNFEFGLSRIFKSVEPLQSKLSADTWYYVKLALLALCEQLAKHTLMVRDEFLEDTFAFLTACEQHGRSVLTVLEDASAPVNRAVDNVAAEARLIKRLLIKLRD